jgi:homogentisate 1,2-dioxygenase
MRKWISFPRSEGKASRQAHADLPEGTYEREMGREGFSGPATHFYHRHPPTGWVRWDGPLRPRAFDTKKLAGFGPSPLDARALMHNDHIQVRFWRTEAAMDHLVRNGDGDELIFVHEGAGALFCDFGHLEYRDGDYIAIPRGTMWRIAPSSPTALLTIEATNDAYRLPEKGIVGDHAIFDPAVLDTPKIDEAFTGQQSEQPWQLRIRRRGAVSTVTFPYNPLDAVGWKGDLIPVRLNWRDIRPIMSHRFHIPPSAHANFIADRFIVGTFAPRPMESDPGAMKVPFFHNNDDYDEFIFYHRGSFFSRDNIHPGMITLHPSGTTHGPHPKALAAGSGAARPATDEVAVYIDARDALVTDAAADAVEWAGYVGSWGMNARRDQAAE